MSDGSVRDIPPAPWEATKWSKALAPYKPYKVASGYTEHSGWQSLDIEDTGEGWTWVANAGMGVIENPDRNKYATSALAIAAAEAWVLKYPDMCEHRTMENERWVIRHKQYPEKYWCRTVGLSGGWLRNEDKAMELDGIQKREFDGQMPKFGQWHLSYTRGT